MTKRRFDIRAIATDNNIGNVEAFWIVRRLLLNAGYFETTTEPIYYDYIFTHSHETVVWGGISYGYHETEYEFDVESTVNVWRLEFEDIS